LNYSQKLDLYLATRGRSDLRELVKDLLLAEEEGNRRWERPISRESAANVEGLTESPAPISGFRKWERVGHEGKNPDANPRPFR